MKNFSYICTDKSVRKIKFFIIYLVDMIKILIFAK